MLEGREAGGACDGGPEEGVGGAGEREENYGGSKELREIYKEVLVEWVQAVRGEVGGIQVVSQVVVGREDGEVW